MTVAPSKSSVSKSSKSSRSSRSKKKPNPQDKALPTQEPATPGDALSSDKASVAVPAKPLNATPAVPPLEGRESEPKVTQPAVAASPRAAELVAPVSASSAPYVASAPTAPSAAPVEPVVPAASGQMPSWGGQGGAPLVSGHSSTWLLGALGLAALAGGGGGGGGGGTTADTTAPTVTVSDNVANTANGPVTYTVTFSEVVTGFGASKLSLSGGTLSSFVAHADGKTFTVVASPDAAATGTLRLSVSTSGVSDAAGNAAVAPAIAEQAYAQNVLQGSIVAGPVVARHQLSVRVFDAAGQVIGTAMVDATGTYKVGLGAYSGPVVVLLMDADDAQADYVDEVSRAPIDLSGHLLAAGQLTATDTVQILNINPITTVAALKAGVHSADGNSVQLGSATAEVLQNKITASNTAVAKAMGLGNSAADLLTGSMVPTVNVDGSLNANANHYGKMLAVLAGMDAANNGDASQTLNTLVAGISDSGSLSGAVGAALVQGAVAAGLTPADVLSDQPGTFAAITGTATKGQVLTAGAILDADGGVTGVVYQWKANGENISGATRSTLTLTQAEVGQAITVVATYMDNHGLGKGVTSAATAPVLALNPPPVFTSGSRVSLGENGVGTVYTAEVVPYLPEGVIRFSLSGPDAALFDVRADTGALSFKTAPDYEQPKDADANRTYLVLITATEAGNANTAVRAVAITVSNVNEAPTASENFNANVVLEAGTPLDIGLFVDYSEPDAQDTLSYEVLSGALPPGLALSANGQLTGTATAVGVYNLVIRATDREGLSHNNSYQMRVRDTQGPVFESDGLASVVENSTSVVYTPVVSDNVGVVGFELAGGDDDSLFALDAQTGALRFLNAPDFENPAGVQANNLYAVRIKARDAAGNGSEHEVWVEVVNSDEAGSMAIIGMAEQGKLLEAGAVSDPDGGVVNVSYQWQADGTSISGATRSTLTLSQAEVGKVITVVAAYTDDHGGAKSVTSPGTLPVLDINDLAVGEVVISGSAGQGQTLVADVSGIRDPDGTALDFSFQWQAAASLHGEYTNIDGATQSSYAIIYDPSLLGQHVRVLVTALNDGTVGGTLFRSLPSAAVLADVSPPDAMDLSASSMGVQSAATVSFISPELRSGKPLFAGVQAPMANDVAGFRLVLGDNWQLQAGADQLMLEVSRSLHADFSGQNVSMGGVSGLDYSYTASSKTLMFYRQLGGAIAADDVPGVLAAFGFRTSSASGLTRTLELSYVDRAHNVGEHATVSLVTDARPGLALRTDTGLSPTDGTTHDPVLRVTGLLSGASWQYRATVDGSWIDGTGTSLSLPHGVYADGQLQVRQRDAYGQWSEAGSVTGVRIDLQAPVSPSLRLSLDDGVSPSDGLTQQGGVTVSLLEPTAVWEYSVDRGATWSSGTGSSWVLQPASYSAGQVQVRQTDLAGHVSVAGSNANHWWVDDGEAPVVQSFTVSGSDGDVLLPGATATVRLVFNEVVAQLTADDLTVPHGTLSQWASADGGKTWTAVYTPAMLTWADDVVLTLSGVYADLWGATGPVGLMSNALVVDTMRLDSTRGWRITGAQVGEYSGAAVGFTASYLGAAGLSNVVIGSPYLTSENAPGWMSGGTYLLAGRTATSDQSLADLTPGLGLVWQSSRTEAALGWQVTGLGDVNGDGVPDVAVTAPTADAVNGTPDAGRLYVLTAAGTGATPAGIEAGQGGWMMDGAAEGDALGWSVAAAGDVDGDGLADVLVGAPYADAPGDVLDAGQVRLVRGSVDGTAGAQTVWQSPNAGDWLGFAVAGGGDFNGDGLADVVLAAPDADVQGPDGTLTDAGEVYVVYGNSTGMASLVDVAQGMGGRVVRGFAEGQSIGHAVASVGDVNGDGKDDLLIGAPDHLSSRGGAWLVWGGADTTALDLGNASGQAVHLFNGQEDVAQLGYALSGAGDFNGDGFADVLLAAPGTDGLAGSAAGAAYVVFGKAAADWGSSLDVTQLRLSNGTGLVYHGQAAGDGLQGMAVAGGGDVNGDGLPDLLVGFAAAADGRGVTQVLLGDAVYRSAVL